MRFLKTFAAILIILFIASCESKHLPEPSLAGHWKITSAVGNDGRHWTGTFTLSRAGGANSYTGLIYWDTIDGSASGTDSITGQYNESAKILTMQSTVITGNIESVVYTMNITGNATIMTGVWTGSSDGTVANPGHWAAAKQ